MRVMAALIAIASLPIGVALADTPTPGTTPGPASSGTGGGIVSAPVTGTPSGAATAPPVAPPTPPAPPAAPARPDMAAPTASPVITPAPTPPSAPATQASPPAPATTSGAAPPASSAKPAEPDTKPPRHVELPTTVAASILGRTVQSPEKADIGRIIDVLVDGSGRPRAAVIDVGGFLGIGNRHIAVAWSSLHFQPASDGSVTITLDMTKDQISNSPAWKGPSATATVALPGTPVPAPPVTH